MLFPSVMIDIDAFAAGCFQGCGVKAPDKSELEDLVQLISQRVGRCLERQGLLEQDTESAWLDLDPAEDYVEQIPVKMLYRTLFLGQLHITICYT